MDGFVDAPKGRATDMNNDSTGNHATDYGALAPFRAAVSRRRFFGLGGAAAGMAVAGSQLGGLAGSARAAAATAGQSGRTGTVADLKRVVILMQENRSFDHYYGSLRGIRGYGDKQALRYPN